LCFVELFKGQPLKIGVSNLKRKSLKWIAFSIFLLSVFFLAMSCNKPNYINDIRNKDVIYTRNFSINTGNIGLKTSVQGTAFVKRNQEKPDNEYIQIAAWIEKDPKDWGGIGFITRGWKVTNIDSSYGYGQSSKSEIIIRDLFENRTGTSISIGNYYLGLEGGKPSKPDFSLNEGENITGSVVINMEKMEGYEQGDNLDITIGAGSQGEILKAKYWPVKETITIPLNLASATP
jgi:hypothetical protein